MAQHKELAVKIRKMNKGLISSSVFWLHFIPSLCQSCGNQSASMTRRTAPPFVRRRRRMLEVVELARVQLLRRDPPACRQSGLCAKYKNFAVHLTPICTKFEKTWICCGINWGSLFTCTFKLALLVTFSMTLLKWHFWWHSDCRVAPAQCFCDSGDCKAFVRMERCHSRISVRSSSILSEEVPPREDPFFTHCLKFKDLKQS